MIRSFARTPMHDTKGDAWSMPLSVVPPFSVETSPGTQIIPAGTDPSAELSVVIRSTEDRASGTVRPEIPSGWKVEPQSATIEFNHSGEHASEFKVLPDGAKEARYSVRALLNSGGRDYDEGYSLVARPDIGGFFLLPAGACSGPAWSMSKSRRT